MEERYVTRTGEMEAVSGDNHNPIQLAWCLRGLDKGDWRMPTLTYMIYGMTKLACVSTLDIERLDLDEIQYQGRIRCADDEGVGRGIGLRVIIDQNKDKS